MINVDFDCLRRFANNQMIMSCVGLYYYVELDSVQNHKNRAGIARLLRVDVPAKDFAEFQFGEETIYVHKSQIFILTEAETACFETARDILEVKSMLIKNSETDYYRLNIKDIMSALQQAYQYGYQAAIDASCESV